MAKYIPKIFLYFLMVVIMIGLAFFIKNDYVLTGIYIAIILGFTTLKRERADFPILMVGLVGTLIGEYLFVSTGIEIFTRTSLLGIMPLWLPFLWSYIFLAMKRVFWMLIKEYL